MVNTKAGVEKAMAKIRAKYGDDYFRKLGHKGGTAKRTKPAGFKARPDLAPTAGRKGGLYSKRGFKMLKRDGNVCTYQDNYSGEIHTVHYREHLVLNKPKEVKHGKGKKSKGKEE